MFLSLSTTFWENISSYPMIHQLDFIYFIVSALNHFHCEYIIVFGFLPFFFILSVFLFIQFCYLLSCCLSNRGCLIESPILLNFIFSFLLSPWAKYFQKYILSLSLHDIIPFSCVAVFPHRLYMIFIAFPSGMRQDLYRLSLPNDSVSWFTCFWPFSLFI